MGTPEEKARRQQYLDSQAKVQKALESGQIRSDADLQKFLQANGMNPNGPLYKEYFSAGNQMPGAQGGGGLKEIYGPSADPMKEYDLANGTFRWRITNPDGSLKYPNWNPVDPTELARIQGFYNWRQSPEGQQLAQQYGGSSIAAWYANHGNSPDMSWTGKEYAPQMNGSAAYGQGGAGGSGAFPPGSVMGNALGGAFTSQAELNAELARQARLDTMSQQFNLERAANEYSQAQPLEKYMTDLYGSILGVKFNQPSQYSLSNYFNSGMQGVGGATSGALTQPWQNSGTITAPSPFTGPIDNGNTPPAPPGTTGGSEPPYPGNPEMQAFSDQGAVPFDESGGVTSGGGTNPVGGPGDINNPSPAPYIDDAGVYHGPDMTQGGLPGMSGPYAPPSYSSPLLPQGSYEQNPEGYNPNNPQGWAFLAQPASQIASQYDAAREQLKRLMPMGGERNAQLSGLAKSAYGQVAGLRQGLVQNALAGISGLAGAKKGYAPGGYSGGAQSLLGSADTQRGQDVSRYGIDRGYQQGLMSLQNQNAANSSNNTNSLFSGLGNLLANSGWWQSLGK